MKSLSNIKRYIQVTGMDEIARRYFVMNAFDGALTMLGILVGAYLSGDPQVAVIISAGLGACIAMGVSGVSGAYMTEKAERRKKLNDLENIMLVKLKDTVHGRASQFASIYTAIIDGLSPALAAIVILSPFIATRWFVIEIQTLFLISIGLTAIVLFLLGSYLAKISDESMFKYGSQMVVVGIITGFIIMGVSLLFGSPAH